MNNVDTIQRAPALFSMEELTSVPPGLARTELVSRLVSQVYVEAPVSLRAGLLECLLRPIGPLALSAVAAGAFAIFVYRSAWNQLAVVPASVTRFSANEVLELARFVEQYQPDVLGQIVHVLSDYPTCLQSVAGSMLFLALRLWSVKRQPDED